MRIVKYPRIIPVISLCFLLSGLSPAAFSAGANLDWLKGTNSAIQRFDLMILAEAENDEANDETPRSGSLVLPLTADDDKSEKKCMTICQRWGQDCMIDSTRGVRKCRRTCKEFGQECF